MIAICKWYNARMKYKSNNNVVYSCKYHVVFCPKYRRPVLVDGVDERFKQIAQQVADGLHFEIIEMEDVPLAYYPGNTNRVKIKAAGDLS